MTRLAPALALAASLLALAACGGKAPQEEAAPAPEPAATEAAAVAEPPAGESEPGTIPAAFHGVWDAETGTCNPASDLRMEIGPRAITFYESHGTVTAANPIDASSVDITLAMTGEGESWTDTMRLLVSGTGPDAVLAVQRDEPAGQRATGLIIQRKRCPG